MWFNRIAAVVLAAACAVVVGRHLTGDTSGWADAALVLCAVAVAGVLARLLRTADREPAVFVAGAYVTFGVIAAAVEALSAEWIRAGLAVATLPFVYTSLVTDARTRNWVNRIGGYHRSAA